MDILEPPEQTAGAVANEASPADSRPAETGGADRPDEPYLVRQARPGAWLAASCSPRLEALDFDILVAPSCYRAAWEYVRLDLAKELGGVLVGQCCRDPNTGRRYTYATDFIPAIGGVSRPSSFTFTVAAWTYIAQERARRYGDDGPQMVGWVHSHPRLGIFLSTAFDEFIQEHWFGLAWQVAWVIDPCTPSEGFFGWSRQPVRLPQMPFYLAVEPSLDARETRGAE